MERPIDKIMGAPLRIFSVRAPSLDLMPVAKMSCLLSKDTCYVILSLSENYKGILDSFGKFINNAL